MNIFSWNEFITYIVRKRVRVWLAMFALYLSIAGLVTFSLFILEESFQTIMFGTWPAQDAQRWDVVLKGTDLMEKTIYTMKIVNYSCGWIQPLAFVSYRSYAKSGDYYVEGLRTKILAHQPELLIGRKIKVKFHIKQIKKLNEKFILSNGRLKVISDKRKTGIIDIEGILQKTEVGYELTKLSGGTIRNEN